MGILKRPWKGWDYEKLRVTTNESMRELTQWMNSMFEEKGLKGVNFMDLDNEVDSWSFEADGLHLQREAVEYLAGKIKEKILYGEGRYEGRRRYE